MDESNYNGEMSSKDIFIKEPLGYNIEGAIYYRDLLSFLIKTYGH